MADRMIQPLPRPSLGGKDKNVSEARDRPILFSGPMVLALLAGRKSQTRRVLKPQPDENLWPILARFPNQAGYARWNVGDRLWVREAGAFACATAPIYKADLPVAEWPLWKWRPSIRMPRWASRLTLTVTDVRVQRIQDISEEDADAEGFGGDFPTKTFPEFFGHDAYHWSSLTIPQCFGVLWDRIHAADGPHGWNANPWVAALTFTVEQRNIDAPASAAAGGGR